jgi:hypothetical protein
MRSSTGVWLSTMATVGLLIATPALPRAEDFVPLVGNRAEGAAGIASEADAPGAKVLRMQLYLAPRNGAKLDRLVEA